jgi:adenosylhomocysteine nucleosidase
METTALAQVAHVHGVPFLAVRGISDLCGPAGADDFLPPVAAAAERSAAVVLGVLARVGATA